MLVDIAFFMFGLAAAGLLGLIVYMWLWGDTERTYTAEDLKDYYGAREDEFAKNYYTPAPVEEVVKTRRSKRIRSRKSNIKTSKVSGKSRKPKRRGNKSN